MAKRSKFVSPPSYRRRINPIPLYLAAVAVLVSVFAVLSLTVLFRLEEFRIEGDTIYTEEQITAATGLAGRENLVRLRADEIEQRILANLPYIETVTVKKDLPATLVITCTPAEEYAFYRESGIGYIVDRTGRVLAETRETETTLIRLSGVTAPSASLAANTKEGKRTYLTFDSDRTREAFTSITENLDNNSFGKVTRINVPSYLDLSFVIEDRIRVRIGTMVDLEYKMTFIRTVFEKEDAVPAEGYAVVDVSNTDRGASVKTNVNNDLTEADILG